MTNQFGAAGDIGRPYWCLHAPTAGTDTVSECWEMLEPPGTLRSGTPGSVHRLQRSPSRNPVLAPASSMPLRTRLDARFDGLSGAQRMSVSHNTFSKAVARSTVGWLFFSAMELFPGRRV